MDKSGALLLDDEGYTVETVPLSLTSFLRGFFDILYSGSMHCSPAMLSLFLSFWSDFHCPHKVIYHRG